VISGGHQSGDVGHIHHQQATRLVGDLPQPGEIDHPRISAGTGHQQLGAMFQRQAANLVVIDAVGLFIHPVRDEFVEGSGKVDRAPVGQVPAVGQIHAQYGVPRLQHGKIHPHVGLGAGMGLDVGVFRPEQLFGAFPGQLLHPVDIFASAVVSPAGITLRVLVGQDGSQGFQHRPAHEVFRGDQLDFPLLPVQFVRNGPSRFGIRFTQVFQPLRLLCAGSNGHAVRTGQSSARPSPAGFRVLGGVNRPGTADQFGARLGHRHVGLSDLAD